MCRATATALETALGLPPAERRQRAQAMRSAVDAVSPLQWLHRQLADVLKVNSGSAPDCPPPDARGATP